MCLSFLNGDVVEFGHFNPALGFQVQAKCRSFLALALLMNQRLVGASSGRD
jgi:hypothetical protein